MAHQDVYIDLNGVYYVPDPPVVRSLDTVEFHMRNRMDIVTVNFGSNSPFAQNTLTLNGAVVALATQDKTVVTGATPGRYPFWVEPHNHTHIHTGDDPEPPGSLPGDLEVATEGTPPKE